MQITSIEEDKFYCDGRGPELNKVIYSQNGTVIKAIEYYNPDDSYDKTHLKHVLFISPQAFLFTPEEEYAQGFPKVDWSNYRQAGILNLGQTDWFNLFTNRHSSNCYHYRLKFYDQILDIVCNRVEINIGEYV